MPWRSHFQPWLPLKSSTVPSGEKRNSIIASHKYILQNDFLNQILFIQYAFKNIYEITILFNALFQVLFQP